jgi:hypothetical protein
MDKRERERERDVSAALTHLPTGPHERAGILITLVPNELTRKPSLIITTRSLSPTKPLQKRLTSIPEKTDPNPIYQCPAPHDGRP